VPIALSDVTLLLQDNTTFSDLQLVGALVLDNGNRAYITGNLQGNVDLSLGVNSSISLNTCDGLNTATLSYNASGGQIGKNVTLVEYSSAGSCAGKFANVTLLDVPACTTVKTEDNGGHVLAFFQEDTACATLGPGAGISLLNTIIISCSVIGGIILIVIILVAIPQVRHAIFPNHDVDDFAVSKRSD